MTLRQYLIVMLLATFLCWFALVFVMVNVDPFEASLLSLFLFYISFFLAIFGTVSLLLFMLYHFFARRPTPIFRHVQHSFRDGSLFAGLMTAVLYFQAQGWLHLWNSLLFAGAVASLVIFLFFHSTYTNAT